MHEVVRHNMKGILALSIPLMLSHLYNLEFIANLEVLLDQLKMFRVMLTH